MRAMSTASPSSETRRLRTQDAMDPRRPTSVALLLLCVGLLSTPEVRAEGPSADEKAAARDLAISGMEMKDKGDCPGALEKLERAERLYHAPTILTAIGECQIALGQLVEGTESLKRVSLEHLDPNASKTFMEAQKRAKALLETTLPRIAKLTVAVTPDLDEVELFIDEVKVSSALIGVPRPTDPGHHRIAVQKPGYLAATSEVTLAEGADETLSLKLEADPSATPPVEAAPLAAAEEPKPGGSPPPSEKRSMQPVFGWIGIGLGTAAIGAGAITGVLALDQSNHLNCPGNVCTGAEADRLDSASTLATTSTILFGAGGAFVVTGIVLLLTSPSPSASGQAPFETQIGKVHLTPEVYAGGAALRGRF